MSRLDSADRDDVGRASAEVGRRDDGRDAVTFPGDHVVCRNDGTGVVELTVVRRCEGRTERDTVGLARGDAISLPLPRGDGPVTVEVHGPDAMAVTTVEPAATRPLFVRRDGGVLVVRD